ncbi:MAG: TonB-dependent receptor [Saprospiraceae bacterium]|nr:TonB-dependent receptor [Saprospiraceae bacterium]
MIRFLIPALFLLACVAHAQPLVDTLAWSIDLNNVVVTAQYAPTDARSAIHAVRVLNKADISRRFAATLDDVLSYDAGIRIRQDMVLGSALSLLGQDGQGIKILLDGVPVIGRMNGNVDLGQLPLHQIERIEIVEGPLSVQYGTDALGGVINIITRPTQLKRIETGLRSSYESIGEQRMDGSIGYWVLPKLLIRAEGGYLKFDGFGDEETRDLLWNPKEQWYAGAQVRYNLTDKQSLRYRFNYMDETIDNLGIERRPQFKPYAFDDYYYTQRQDHTLHWNGSWREDLFFTEVILSNNSWNRIKKRQRTDLTTNELQLIVGEQDTNALQAWHLRSTFSTKLPGRINGMAGLELRRDIATGNRIIDPYANREGLSQIDDHALFGSLRYRIVPKIEVEGGLRWSYNERFTAPAVPSIHVRWEVLDGLTARASYARGFRAPTAKELYFEFLDANHFILGNPDLKPETSDNLQTSLHWTGRTGKWNHELRTTLFYNDVRDRIGIYEFYEKDGVKIPARGDTVTLQFAHFNYDRFRNHGLQGQLKSSWNGLHIQASVMINGYYQPESKNDAAVPANTYAREYGWDASYSLKNWATTFSVMGRYYDKLVSFYPEPANGESVVRQRIQKGFSLVDLNVGQPLWDKRLILNAGVRNLFNIQRTGVLDNGASLQHNSGSGDLPVSPGRTWLVGLEWRG